MKTSAIVLVAFACALALPGCASNGTRSAQDSALAREQAAYERGRQQAEEDARQSQLAQQQQQQQRRNSGLPGIGAPNVMLPPPPAVPAAGL